MGAKFTLVLDTDDPAGLRDALEIALLLNRNHNTGYESSMPKAKIGKIAMQARRLPPLFQELRGRKVDRTCPQELNFLKKVLDRSGLPGYIINVTGRMDLPRTIKKTS